MKSKECLKVRALQQIAIGLCKTICAKPHRWANPARPEDQSPSMPKVTFMAHFNGLPDFRAEDLDL
jgi:hypothetical protein